MFSRRAVLKIGASALTTVFAVPSQVSSAVWDERLPLTAFSKVANLYGVLFNRTPSFRSATQIPGKTIICSALNWAKDQGYALPRSLEERDQLQRLISKYIDVNIIPIYQKIDLEMNRLRVENLDFIKNSFTNINSRSEILKLFTQEYGIKTGQIIWNYCNLISRNPNSSFELGCSCKLNLFQNFYWEYERPAIRELAQNILDLFHCDINNSLDSKTKDLEINLAREFILRESFDCERQRIYDCMINNGTDSPYYDNVFIKPICPVTFIFF